MNIGTGVYNIVRSASDLVFPRVCHLCGNRLNDGDKYLCPLCLSRLPRTRYHRTDMNPMEHRFAGLFPFEHAAGHFFYSTKSGLATLMQDLKYHHYRGLARYIGEVMGQELYTTPFLSDIDLIIPIPMYFLKKARRGYNQTEEIAKGLGSATGIPIKTILKAVKPHKAQAKLSGERRIHNIKDIFRIDNADLISGKHVLLLDDVCTTGTTLTKAAETILAASPTTRISLLTVGVTF